MDTVNRKIESSVEIFTDDRNLISYTSNFMSKIDRYLMSDIHNKSYASRIFRRENTYKNKLPILDEYEENEGYKFVEPAVITLYLGKTSDVKLVHLCGDRIRGEYPINFEIVFKNMNKKAITSFIIRDNKEMEFTKKISVKGVRYIELRIHSWNTSNYEPIISRFYGDDYEVYEQEDLLTMECLHEKVNNSEIKYGLSSDYCNVKILNKDRMFDEGKSHDKNYLKRVIAPIVNNTRLGTFYINEWKVSQDDMFVECKAYDRLMDFQDIAYPGCMPTEKRHSFYGEFEKILKLALKTKNFRYKIDYCLKNYAFKPYLKAASVWDTLQRLCEASLSHVYVDANNCVIVETELPFDSSLNCYANDSIIIDNKIAQKCGRNIAVDKVYRNITSTFPIKKSLITISPSNAFSIDIPRAANMAVDVVELPWYEKNVGDSEKIWEQNYCLKNGGEVFGEIILEDFYTNYDLKIVNANNLSVARFNVTNLALKFSAICNTNEANEKVEIHAGKICFKKKDLIIANTLIEYIPNRYSHPNCELIYSKLFATTISNAIMHSYPSGTKAANVKWVGNIDLKINDNFMLIDRFGKQNVYKCTSVKTIIDGGMEQEVKGILIK